MDIYSIYYRIKLRGHSYLKVVKRFYESINPNGRIFIQLGLMTLQILSSHIDIFDIPGFNKYELLINFINYETIYNNATQFLYFRLF